MCVTVDSNCNLNKYTVHQTLMGSIKVKEQHNAIKCAALANNATLKKSQKIQFMKVLVESESISQNVMMTEGGM